MTRVLARWRLAPGAILALLLAAGAGAEDYLSREDFLAAAFGTDTPQLQTLWLNGAQREAAISAVGWAPAALRLRYWRAGERTAWILEDIGKDKPITLGVSVRGDAIERVDVLAFRESRGWEIRYPFFTNQFDGMTLTGEGKLSKPVDGITGATLSVRAVERVARLALWLDAQVNT